MASTPRSTACHDWCISEEMTLYQKVNTPKEPIHEYHTAMPEEKCVRPKLPPSGDLSILQTPVSQNMERTIEITEYDEDHVQLISSDEGEQTEVDDPPQPTITIERFDEDELEISSKYQPGVRSKVSGQVSSVVRHVDIKRTIQIIDYTELDSSEEEDVTTQPKIINHVEILSSEEDEEIDVGLELQPNITIESFDIDETSMVNLPNNDSDITENVVDYEDRNIPGTDISQFISNKYPAMLEGDLDFHHLKGTENLHQRRTFCRELVRAEMEKFYNESWGGEIFDHEKILKHMPRDKHLWVIDERDRLRDESTVICDHCDLPGHRDDTCPTRTPVCYMCGAIGHLEPSCPMKNCLICGSPKQLYSSVYCDCCSWGALAFSECGQRGHLSSHCPDMWRRYHSTIDNNAPNERCDQSKEQEQYHSINPHSKYLYHKPGGTKREYSSRALTSLDFTKKLP